jgi:nucleotide-binding universal stress UspA family protein
MGIAQHAAQLAQKMAPSLTVETGIFVNDVPARVLTREAAAAELLVLGANRHGRIMGAFLGSTAIYVVELATGPL